MSVTTEVVLEPSWVRVHCSGTCSSAAELKATFRIALDVARESHKRRVLIDAIEVTGQLSTVERREGARYLCEADLADPSNRIAAIAVAGREPLVDPTRFGETAARERGCNGRVFVDLTEATEWLASIE